MMPLIPQLVREWKKPDVPELFRKKDLPGLTRALSHPDLRIQWQAAQALGQLGSDAVDYLIGALKTRDKETKIGIIEALGIIGDKRAINPLVALLQDHSNEVRWEVALALGEMEDKSAIEPLKQALRDIDKYVRYGAALSLKKLSWVPGNKEEEAFLLTGLQEWDEVVYLGTHAIPAVKNSLRDLDRNIRLKAVLALQAMAVRDAIPVCYQAIRDPDEEVRWEAVHAAVRCGLPMRYLPRALARRPRERKNPLIAAFMNFMLPGMGYSYLGLWWGLLIFQADVYATLWIFTITGEFLSLSILFPLYFLLAFHAWYIARKKPDI